MERTFQVMIFGPTLAAPNWKMSCSRGLQGLAWEVLPILLSSRLQPLLERLLQTIFVFWPKGAEPVEITGSTMMWYNFDQVLPAYAKPALVLEKVAFRSVISVEGPTKDI